MNKGEWRWDTEHQFPAGAMFAPVLCLSNKTELINSSGKQHGWPLDLTIGDILRVSCWICITPGCILAGLIPCCPNSVRNSSKVRYNVIGNVLPVLRNLDLTCQSLEWDCANQFQRQYYHLLATWLGDYPELVKVTKVSYCSYAMTEMTTGVLTGHSTMIPYDYWRERQVYSELLDNPNIDALNTVGVYPICNQFWQHPEFNLY